MHPESTLGARTHHQKTFVHCQLKGTPKDTRPLSSSPRKAECLLRLEHGPESTPVMKGPLLPK